MLIKLCIGVQAALVLTPGFTHPGILLTTLIYNFSAHQFHRTQISTLGLVLILVVLHPIRFRIFINGIIEFPVVPLPILDLLILENTKSRVLFAHAPHHPSFLSFTRVTFVDIDPAREIFLGPMSAPGEKKE